MTTPRDNDPALHVRSAPQGRIPDFSPVTDAMRTLEGACPPPWAMYQDRRFLEICTRHYGWALADWSGILGVERRLPGVGGLRGRVWSPEARAPGTWAQALADSGVGILDVITNEAVDHPGFQRTSPADLVSMIVRIEDDLDDKGNDRRGGKGGRGGGGGGMNRRKVCRFCAETTTLIDYKNPQLLRSFVTDRGKMVPRRISGSCAKHQRAISVAVRRARMLALLPITVGGE